MRYLSLTHLSPMHPFSAPWRYHQTLRFSDVFIGWGKGSLGINGLKQVLWLIENSSAVTDDTQRPSGISTQMNIAVVKDIHVQNGSKATLVFFPAYGEGLLVTTSKTRWYPWRYFVWQDSCQCDYDMLEFFGVDFKTRPNVAQALHKC